MRKDPADKGHRSKERFLKGQIHILNNIKRKMLLDEHPYARVPDRQIGRIRVDLGLEYITGGSILPGFKELLHGLSLNPAYALSKFGFVLASQSG